MTHFTPKAFIFDCDGTLVNSEEPGIRVIHQLAKDLGVEMGLEEAMDRFTGQKMADIVKWVGQQLASPLPLGFHEHFTRQVRQEQSRRFQEGLETIPGAKELLASLDLPKGVATNGPMEKVELTLSLTGLREFFAQHVYSAYDMGYFKPSPKLFLHVAKALGVPARDCAVVEDSLTGVTAGLEAQMQVFSLAKPKHLPQPLHAKVTFIADLHELRNLLSQNRSLPLK